MHVRTTLPSAARAKNLRRQGRVAEAREIAREDDDKHSHEDSDYGLFGYIQDGVRPYSVGSAMELAYHAVWAGSGALHTPLGGAPIAVCAALAPPGPEALPRVLFEHTRALLSSHRDDADDVARWTACRPALVAARLRLDRVLAGRAVGQFACMYATLFAPFWVRPPETWAPPAGGDARACSASLVRHLFARYTTHPSLLRAWDEGSEDALKWVLLVCDPRAGGEPLTS
jgi:hypothetical protein